MAYLMQPPEQNIIYFMQESAKLIPKVENKEWGPSPCCTRDGHTEYREHNYSPCLRNCSRMGQSSSSISTETLSQNYNAMELLNLISNKCTRLNNLDVGHSSGMRDDLELKLCEVENDFRGVREVKEGRPPTSDEVNIACSKRGQERKGGTILECENPITNCNKKKVVTRQTGREELSNCTSGEVLTNGGNDVQKEGKDKALEGGSLAKKEALDQGIYSRKTPRKQRTPAKSVQKFDPSFQGIEFQLHLGFEKENFGDCHLIVTSFYRGKSRRGSVKSKRRLNSASLSSGSEDDQNSQLAKKTKQCASCKTQKTPLWRDAEDGTPLCNACGIRYKKYKVRCYNCWNIPKKDGKSYSKYCDCGGAFRSHI